MNSRDMWDDDGYEVYEENEFPLAYLLTFRTYGTWLHGDRRRSVYVHGKNLYGSPKIDPNERLLAIMRSEMKKPPVVLTPRQRDVVEDAVRSLCDRRGYVLHAVNARTNHVHSVISAEVKPERLVDSLKAEATKKLRERNAVNPELRIWSRGRSRRYLWKPRHVDKAIDYVVYGQGDGPFALDDDDE